MRFSTILCLIGVATAKYDCVDNNGRFECTETELNAARCRNGYIIEKVGASCHWRDKNNKPVKQMSCA